MKSIYLDYNATTPLDPLVATTMLPYLTSAYGNPSSSHIFGVDAKLAVEKARKQLAILIGCHADEIIFTSGGSEANNLAIKGVAFSVIGRGNHLITSVIEHPAVIEVCRYLEKRNFRITYLKVDEFGQINLQELKDAICPETILITIMHANNEVGTIQPVEKIGEIARKNNIPFHSDAAQTIGKICVDVTAMHVDLLSIAGHKFYAPKGVGALYVRRGVKLEKLIHGADQEQNVRAGTENVMQIVGLGKAAELAAINNLSFPMEGSVPDWRMKIAESKENQPFLHYRQEDMIRQLRDKLHQGIKQAIPEIRLNGHPNNRLPNTLSLGFPGVDAAILLEEMKEIATSAGAACHAGRNDVSVVLEAMKVPLEYAMGTIRFSLGRMTTPEEVEIAIPIIVESYRRLLGGSHKAGGFKMTHYTHSLGCACKIRPQLLEEILKKIPPIKDKSALVGYETSDDAAVYQIDEENCIVETVDFIPPVVDDPYTYGAIAAANALSDIYAMGAKPLFALSIVSFPVSKLPMEVLHLILQGAGDKVAEAGINIIGGHSIDDSEPKFGLVVTGKVHPRKILHNSSACPGDAIILTKPIGTGIITTALKRGLAEPENIRKAIDVMTELNLLAAEVMTGFPINACTDVTGFGLLGHLKEVVEGSKVGAEIVSGLVPLIPETWEYATAGCISGGTLNNVDFVKPVTRWDEGIPELLKIIFADAQTSGGLLLTLPEEVAPDFLETLGKQGNKHARIIGKIIKGDSFIFVRNKISHSKIFSTDKEY